MCGIFTETNASQTPGDTETDMTIEERLLVEGGEYSGLYWALWGVESHWSFEPDISGDDGISLGPLQISYPYWKDAYEHDPTLGGSYEKCSEVNYSFQVMGAYWRRYSPDSYRNLDFQVLARIHNGGPTGNTKPETLKYWDKVQKNLERFDEISSR